MVNLDEGGLQVGSVSGRIVRAGGRCQPEDVALDSIPAGRGFDCGWTGAAIRMGDGLLEQTLALAMRGGGSFSL
jgi:hypothetical protein